MSSEVHSELRSATRSIVRDAIEQELSLLMRSGAIWEVGEAMTDPDRVVRPMMFLAVYSEVRKALGDW